MAEPLPPALKIPEVSRFINRANQLRTIKPAIAYWCEYHAVNQIVGKSLHTTDDDTFNFTKTLIERLETTKTERADDDAIVDNTAGQAYVEQFAQQTFERAERTLRANKVTRQTADTFDAAATFFDLTREWGPPDAETLQKIKFAKWNAARILKAIREGKDPNESNPAPPEPEPSPALDPNDPDVRQIASAGRPVSVEDVPDAGEVPNFVDQPPRPQGNEMGYFPESRAPAAQAPEPFVPSPLSPSSTPGISTLPHAPPPLPTQETPSSYQQIPPQPSPHIPTKLPPQFAPPPPTPPAVPSGPVTPFTFTAPVSSGPPPVRPQPPVVPSGPPAWSPAASAPPPIFQNPTPIHPPPSAPSYTAPPPVAPVAPVQTGGYKPNLSQKDINQAQKHAKWAISALNFEDVPTAVQELRNALAMLGAR